MTSWRRVRPGILAALFIAGGHVEGRQTPTHDGALVDQTPCPPLAPLSYEQYVESARQRHAGEVAAAAGEGRRMSSPLAYATRADFTRERAESATIDCHRVRYRSDGSTVVGFLWKPKNIGTGRLPLIIFNRGGNGEFGKLPPWHNVHRFAAQGFVVIASQYRGNDDGEGQEEFGGADVRDILNLAPLAASLRYVDMNNIFMLGWSRGGMMTFLALKLGMRVNAAAVGGALVDLEAEAVRRPRMVTNVWAQLIPNFATRQQEALRERSVVAWPEKITAPVLIMHGGADWRADPAEALVLAQKLQSAGKPYELIVYAGDDHSITANKQDSNRRIAEWFRKHMK